MLIFGPKKQFEKNYRARIGNYASQASRRLIGYNEPLKRAGHWDRSIEQEPDMEA
jgi:hypothetical protein